MNGVYLVGESILFHLASGQAFFSGVFLLLLSVLLSFRLSPGATSRIRRWLAVLGFSLIVLSSTPQPVMLQAVLVTISLLWLASEKWGGRRSLVLLVRTSMILAWLVAVGLEWPYHRMPNLPRVANPILGVIGDSVTAGMGDGEAVTWPNAWKSRYPVPIRDHAEMGATVAAARKQAARLQAEENIVVLEIGGNDILGSTHPVEFEQGLERLLTDVCQPGRTVIMFELPLPPFHHRFGLIQRQLAEMHGVFLVPKRRFLAILRQADATLDSIHLTSAGHQLFAETVWTIVRPAVSEVEERPLK